MQRYFRLDGLNVLNICRQDDFNSDKSHSMAIFVLVAPLFDAYLIKQFINAVLLLNIKGHTQKVHANAEPTTLNDINM